MTFGCVIPYCSAFIYIRFLLQCINRNKAFFVNLFLTTLPPLFSIAFHAVIQSIDAIAFFILQYALRKFCRLLYDKLQSR